MAGNVWEWVQDEWHTNYNGAPSDGSGWCAGDCPVNASDPNYNASDNAVRVLRGGGWANGVSIIRAARRVGYSPSFQNGSFGGRLTR